jgi:hypothetical protein
MSVNRRAVVGNVLGAARAEADSEMLSKAFVETADYRALVETKDFNYVVGRRGTGKSALYGRVTEHFNKQPEYFTFAAKPQEYEALDLQKLLSEHSNIYTEMRAIARIVWKLHILLLVLKHALTHYRYKVTKSEHFSFLANYASEHRALLGRSDAGRCVDIIRKTTTSTLAAKEIPGRIASNFHLSQLQTSIGKALTDIKRQAVVFYDGLDEGWLPTPTATAVLGGLALAIADLDESQSNIHSTIFVRDNMFRALAHFDDDFSRHIEGHSLRLHWDADSLFQLVTNRLRIVLNLQQIESSIKIWNRFAAAGLENRAGFEKCLQQTLYRPRDILVLLNHAYIGGVRKGHDRIIETDIDSAAKSISHDRVEDLLKEYDTVLPGLKSFVQVFEARPAFQQTEQTIQMLDMLIESSSYDKPENSDFALFGSGGQILQALYGVGFIGLENKTRDGYIFCHDGSRSNLDLSSDLHIIVHPCYWKALDLQTTLPANDFVIQVNDEYDLRSCADIKDLRVRQLGQIIAELPRLPHGKEGSGQFEDWVFRAVKILFSGKLKNPELKPNPEAVMQRDIVATNMAPSGFWRRVYEDFETRQMIFEVKNYESIRLDDYRQVLSYTGGPYGKFAVIVSRTSSEGIAETEREWIREIWFNQNRLIFSIPCIILSRSLSKLRTVMRFDYVEDALTKRLDTYIRSYLNIKHSFKKRNA